MIQRILNLQLKPDKEQNINTGYIEKKKRTRQKQKKVETVSISMTGMKAAFLLSYGRAQLKLLTCGSDFCI